MFQIYRNFLITVFLILFPIIVSGQTKARKFDEIGQAGCEEIKLKLDQLVIEIQKNPNDKAYIIFYGGRKYLRYFDDKKGGFTERKMLAKCGESAARLRHWDFYLTKIRDIEKAKFEIINGGYRQNFMVEFWFAPRAAEPPRPTPTLTEKEIKFGEGKPKDASFQHWNC